MRVYLVRASGFNNAPRFAIIIIIIKDLTVKFTSCTLVKLTIGNIKNYTWMNDTS